MRDPGWTSGDTKAYNVDMTFGIIHAWSFRKLLFKNGFRFHSRVAIDEIFVRKDLFWDDA